MQHRTLNCDVPIEAHFSKYVNVQKACYIPRQVFDFEQIPVIMDGIFLFWLSRKYRAQSYGRLLISIRSRGAL